MSYDFTTLCADFCAAAQVASPELHEQNDGLVAFTVLWRTVAVDLMARPFDDPDHAFVIFHMGTPDSAHSDFARILQTMLQTNFNNLRAHQPVLSCHPQSHAAMLQWAFPLARMNGDTIYQMVEQGVNLVLEWRQTHFLAPAALASVAPSEAVTASYA